MFNFVSWNEERLISMLGTLYINIMPENIMFDYGIRDVDNVPTPYLLTTIRLKSNCFIGQIADDVRKKEVFHFDPEEESTDCEYEYYLQFTDHNMDNYITLYVKNSNFEDNDEKYKIKMTESNRGYIRQVINQQCIKYFGKSIDTLIEEQETISV